MIHVGKHSSQDSLEKEVINLNGTFPGEIKVKLKKKDPFAKCVYPGIRCVIKPISHALD